MPAKLASLKPRLFRDYKENVSYSLDSWNKCFYLHTNDNAENFKLIKSEHKKKKVFYEVISPKKNTIIGSPLILKNGCYGLKKKMLILKFMLETLRINRPEK